MEKTEIERQLADRTRELSHLQARLDAVSTETTDRLAGLYLLNFSKVGG